MLTINQINTNSKYITDTNDENKAVFTGDEVLWLLSDEMGLNEDQVNRLLSHLKEA